MKEPILIATEVAVPSTATHKMPEIATRKFKLVGGLIRK